LYQTKPYKFTQTFIKNFEERLNIKFTEDNQAYILAQLSTGNPHRKIDDKGRFSEYFTFSIDGKLVTVVCDQNNHKVLTIIIETHKRKQFTN
jgi:hypothetical protein